MAEVVLASALDAAGLGDRVEVASCGTGDWHLGSPMDRRAAAVLTEHGYDPSRHRSRVFQNAFFDEHDAVLAMDSANLADLLALLGDAERGRVLLFRQLDPLAADDDLEVPDPFYGGDEGFEQVMGIVRRTSDAIVGELQRVLDA
jgi:protein-tyrosine phosphatase